MGQGTRKRHDRRRLRVVVTRAALQAGPLAERIAALGYDVVACPLIEIEPLGDEPIDAAAYDWVVVTSAIGPGTAAELRAHGLEPELVPRVSTQEGLLAELPRPAGRVLVAAAEGARRLAVEELDADFLPLYRTLELAPPEPPAGDVVLLASPSAARAFAATGARIPAVVIGPQTAAAARAAGIEVVAEAETHDEDGLVAALRRLD
jgi:uroporphyrinogen-III synthase